MKNNPILNFGFHNLPDAIQSLADFAINCCVLHCRTPVDPAPRSYRLIEIEVYLHTIANDGPYTGHPDRFAHCAPEQRTPGLWYFHRQNGKTYRGGTRKGLDLTFGTPVPSDRESPTTTTSPYFAGILIRSVEEIASGRVVSGPCLVADEMLQGREKVADFVEEVLGGDLRAFGREQGDFGMWIEVVGERNGNKRKWEDVDDVDDAHARKKVGVENSSSHSPSASVTVTESQSLSSYPSTTLQRRSIASTPRVGLSIKPSHAHIADRLQYLTRPYRFVSIPAPNAVLAKSRPQAAFMSLTPKEREGYLERGRALAKKNGSDHKEIVAIVDGAKGVQGLCEAWGIVDGWNEATAAKEREQ